MRTNVKAKDYRVDEERLAGGYGALAAKQGPEALLRRAVMANLLWEDLAYEAGTAVADHIRQLIPQVEPETVARIAAEARRTQKLRHVPLLIAREMARLKTHKHLVSDLLPRIILRADEITEFVSLYWQDGKQPLSKQVKLGLASAFDRFDAYQLAKYNRKSQVKLKDVLFLVHAKPNSEEQAVLFQQLADDELPTPDTWEVALSGGKDKKEAWERLISEGKLGALAFVRNLRNMEEAKVDTAVIRQGFETINPYWLLPLNYLAAARAAPRWEREIETLMLRGLASAPKLPGYTVFILDVSGSMTARAVNSMSVFNRFDAGVAMLILAAEMCEHVTIYATAGSDMSREHQTRFMPPRRGFALMEESIEAANELGHGGIFTRQCLEFVQQQERDVPDRIIIFSDSQDCDHPHRRVPKPFGRRNYIIDVSAHSRGINYDGLWTAEISGWSEHFLKFIAALESPQQILENI